MQRSNLRRLRAAIEPNGAAGVDLSGVIGNFFDLRFTKAMIGRNRPELRDASVKQNVWQRSPSQFGFKSGGLDFEGYLCSTGVELNAAATPAKDSTSKIIESMIGGYADAAGSLVASGASPTGVTVTVSQGDRFPPSALVAIETGVGTGRYVGAKVKTQSAAAITFAVALGFTPAVGAKVLNSQQLFPTNNLPSVSTSLQFLWEGEDRDHIWLAMGCQGPLGVTWDLGAEVKWSSQFAGMKWLHDDEIATPQGGAALARQTIDGSAPIPVTLGSMLLTPMSGTVRTLPHIAKCAFSSGISWVLPDTYNGIEGKVQPVMVRAEPPTLTVSIVADDETWTDVLEAGTKYQFLAQAGNVAGSILLFECGTLQLIAEPVYEELNGVDYLTLVFMCMEDENTGGQTTDRLRAPYRFGRA